MIFSQFVMFIKNAWHYRRVLSNDCWYDHGYLLSWIDAKLENMENNWVNAHYENSEEEVGYLCNLRSDLKLLIDDTFEDDIFDAYDGDSMELSSDNIQEMIAHADERREIVIERFFNNLKEYRRLWD